MKKLVFIYATLFIFGIFGIASSNTIIPSSSFTTRLYDTSTEPIVVGRDDGVTWNAPQFYVKSNSGYTDRASMEFFIGDLEVASKVYLTFDTYNGNWDSYGFADLTFNGYTANGIVNASDYWYNKDDDSELTSFSDSGGISGGKSHSLDVTDIFNSFKNDSLDYLGFLVMNETTTDLNVIFRNPLLEVIAPVPEPATLILFGLGLLGLAGVNRRKQ